MRYTVNIYQRGADLVYYRGVVQGNALSFTRVIGLKKVIMTQAGDYIDIIYLDADNDYAIDNLGKGHFSYDEATAGAEEDVTEAA